MLTWAVVYIIKISKSGVSGYFLAWAMAGDCYIAYCAASAIIGHGHWGGI